MFNEDDRDFLKGGLHKVTLAGASMPATSAIPTTPGLIKGSALYASLYTAYGASCCGVISTSVATIFNLYAVNASAAAVRFIQLHNSATAVASGAIPKWTFYVGAAPQEHGHNLLSFANGDNFTLGVTYAWSSTPFSFTPVQGGDVGLAVQYK